MNRTDHLLWKLAEECCEVAQRASKAARFGLYEIEPGQDKTNSRRIFLELVDITAVTRLLNNDRLIDDDPDVENLVQEAMKKTEKYLEYSAEMGRLR